MTSSPEFSTFPLNQVPQVRDSRMQFLFAQVAEKMYICRGLIFSSAEEYMEKKEFFLFSGMANRPFPRPQFFYSFTTASGGCTIKPVIS